MIEIIVSVNDENDGHPLRAIPIERVQGGTLAGFFSDPPSLM